MVGLCLQLIERAGHAAEEEKVEQKMAESWEELSLVSSSPTLLRKGIEGVVMKHVGKAARQQKGICLISATENIQETYPSQPCSPFSEVPFLSLD